MKKIFIISSFFLMLLVCANACKDSNKKTVSAESVSAVSTEKNVSADLSEKAVAKFNNYQKAADQGNAMAQNNLGLCYQNGYGIEKSMKKAASLWQKAAEQGSDKAQYNLGMCYFVGDGVERSLEKAKLWLQKAAKQGNADAQKLLAKFKNLRS